MVYWDESLSLVVLNCRNWFTMFWQIIYTLCDIINTYTCINIFLVQIAMCVYWVWVNECVCYLSNGNMHVYMHMCMHKHVYLYVSVVNIDILEYVKNKICSCICFETPKLCVCMSVFIFFSLIVVCMYGRVLKSSQIGQITKYHIFFKSLLGLRNFQHPSPLYIYIVPFKIIYNSFNFLIFFWKGNQEK